MREVFDSAGDYMESGRKDAIINAFSARTEHLQKIAANWSGQKDDLSENVTEDRAETYQ